MDQYDDLAKRLCCRCDKCFESFDDYETLRAHLEANCPKTFDQPSVTEVSQAFSNPSSSRTLEHLIHSLPDLKSQQATTSSQHSSQFSSEVEMNEAKADKLLPDFISRTGPSQSLMDTLKSEVQSGHISLRIYLSVRNFKAATARKQSTLVACEAKCARVQRVAAQYNEAINGKNLALKDYNNAISRHEELCTINSEQEQLIMNDMLSKSLARLKSAYKLEGIFGKSLQQAVSDQMMSNKAASVDLANEQTALNEALKTYEEVENPTAVTRAVFEELMNAQNQQDLNIKYLINLNEKAKKLQGSVLSLMEAAASVARESVHSTNGGSNQQTGASAE